MTTRARGGRAFRAVMSGLALAATACSPPTTPVGEPGDPLPDLSSEQMARFEVGRALFDTDITAAQGLGPAYNQRRCSSCHDVPAVGGSGVERVLRATRWTEGRCDLLRDEGGDNVQPRVTEHFREMGGRGEGIPPRATHTIDMVAPALFGIGLIEAIPTEAILANEDPDDLDGDGISGRAGRTTDGALARFGQKGTHATIRSFVEGALLEEMGLTTEAHPRELPLGPDPLPPGADPAPDPEFDAEQVDLLVDYVRGLAPPSPDAGGRDDLATSGARLFRDVGCADCHVPTFVTSPEADEPIAGRRIALYSDLLLHDLGAEWTGICSPSASPTELRTAPLMGLRHRPILTHDGGSGTLLDAIERHGGEAAASARAFGALAPGARSALLHFLDTL